MRIADFPSIARSTVGFERVMALLAEAKAEPAGGYPPHNIEKLGGEAYRITVAVAGYEPDELSVTTQDDILVVSGRRAVQETAYLHQGIPDRPFQRRFYLADSIKATSARFEGGLLSIDLVREVSGATGPKRIPIHAGGPPAALPRAA
jgi:molecular chaperone IbpA